MIKINKIVEPVCDLFGPDDKLVGEITSTIQLYDIMVQINKEEAKGYYIKWEGVMIRIDCKGSLDKWPAGFYDQYNNLLIELV